MKARYRNTPWGIADCVTPVGALEGHMIVSVCTPSHGGYYVPPELLHHIPPQRRAYAQRWSGSESWYEEDCAWAAVALAFPAFFPVDAVEVAAATAARWIDKADTK